MQQLSVSDKLLELLTKSTPSFVNRIVLQIEEIMPRKLLINKSSELYFVNRFSAKLSSVTRRNEYAWVTEVSIGQNFEEVIDIVNLRQNGSIELAFRQEISDEKVVLHILSAIFWTKSNLCR